MCELRIRISLSNIESTFYYFRNIKTILQQDYYIKRTCSFLSKKYLKLFLLLKITGVYLINDLLYNIVSEINSVIKSS